jgi:antitoxin component of MazEF toxin-antitoxin module
MGLRKLSEQHVRKLQATGENGESYAITLPKELVLELKWRKGQKLSVTKDGKKLIVQDF